MRPSHEECYYSTLVFAKIAYANELALKDLSTKPSHKNPAAAGHEMMVRAGIHYQNAYMSMKGALWMTPEEWWESYGDSGESEEE